MSVYTHYPVPLTITCLTASPGDNKLEDNARIKDDELAGGPPRIIYLGISGYTQAITPSYRATQETHLIIPRPRNKWRDVLNLGSCHMQIWLELRAWGGFF